MTKFPKDEVVWCTYLNKEGRPVFVLTSKHSRDMYFLYKVVEGGYTKLGKASTPLQLEEKFDLNKQIRA